MTPRTRSLRVVADPLPIPSHCWVATGLATAVGSLGAAFAVLLAMLDRSTSVDWWSSYGIWLLDVTVALGIAVGMLLTWRALDTRRLQACLFWAALTLGLSPTPLILSALRVA